VKLNICMMFRDEAKYLKEWVTFHLMMGVEHFYLYDRMSTDDSMIVLRPYIEQGVVDVKYWPRVGIDAQGHEAFIDAHQDCIDRLKGRHEWLAMVDSDEMLFSPRFDTVTEALDNYRGQWGAIGVHWMVFGASDEKEWRDAPVIERFTWRPLENLHYDRWYKSIVRLDDPELRTKGSTHTYHTQWGTFNENGVQLPDNEFTHTSSILRINHYFTKSRPEWEIRHPLEQDGVTYFRDETRWSDAQARDVDDRTIQRFLPALKERLK